MSASANATEQRRCSDCGGETLAMVRTTMGDLLCARCWAETTADRGAIPPAPATDAAIAKVEARP